MDQNDLQQMITYLDSLVNCDDGFDYRIGRSVDGEVTGFVWMTGVMRRDFELFGDLLFVDRLGRPLNDKGWPSITIAMLDDLKKLCIAAEGFTIREQVEAYAWFLRMIVEMAPKRTLADIKRIFADGILAGETLLGMLGIVDSCNIVLDHRRLIGDDIGAWLAKGVWIAVMVIFEE